MTEHRPGGRLLVVLVVVAAGLELAAIWRAAGRDGEGALDLGVAGAAVAAVALLVARMGRPPEVDARLEQRSLVVRFRGWDALWTLRRELTIPLDQVEHATVCRPESLWSGWWQRRLGTVVPGVIKAGWFGNKESRELWDVRFGAEAVDVRLDPRAQLRRLVVQVPDARGLATSLERARHR